MTPALHRYLELFAQGMNDSVTCRIVVTCWIVVTNLQSPGVVPWRNYRQRCGQPRSCPSVTNPARAATSARSLSEEERVPNRGSAHRRPDHSPRRWGK